METIESLRKEIKELKSDVDFYKRYAYNTISFQAMHKDFLDVPAIYYSYSEIDGSYLNVDTFPGIDYEKAYHNLTRKFEKGYAWVMKLIYDKELVEKFRSLAEQKIDDLLAEVTKPKNTKPISSNLDPSKESIDTPYGNRTLDEFNIDIVSAKGDCSSMGFYYDISGTSIEQNRVPIKLIYKHK